MKEKRFADDLFVLIDFLKAHTCYFSCSCVFWIIRRALSNGLIIAINVKISFMIFILLIYYFQPKGTSFCLNTFNKSMAPFSSSIKDRQLLLLIALWYIFNYRY